MRFWLTRILILISVIAGTFFVYFVGSYFFAAPSREIAFEEFGQYQAATTSAPLAVPKLLNYPAPDFESVRFDGSKIKFSDFSQKAVILVFWTTWNPAAQDQLAILESYYQKNKDRGDLAPLAINVQGDKSVAGSFLRRGEYQLPVLLDEDGKVGELYDVNIVPAFYFIDSKGLVRDKYVGVLSENEIAERVAGLVVD